MWRSLHTNIALRTDHCLKPIFAGFNLVSRVSFGAKQAFNNSADFTPFKGYTGQSCRKAPLYTVCHMVSERYGSLYDALTHPVRVLYPFGVDRGLKTPRSSKFCQYSSSASNRRSSASSRRRLISSSAAPSNESIAGSQHWVPFNRSMISPVSGGKGGVVGGSARCGA